MDDERKSGTLITRLVCTMTEWLALSGGVRCIRVRFPGVEFLGNNGIVRKFWTRLLFTKSLFFEICMLIAV